MPVYLNNKIKVNNRKDNFILNTPDISSIPKTKINTNNETITYTHDGSSNDQTVYNLNFENNTLCDIIIVGGGGGGSQAHGGGGGGGALIFMKGVTMNGNYTIKVGKGGNVEGTTGSGTNGRGFKGNNSEIFKTDINKVIAEGGGGGGQETNGYGGDGGSGGGGDAYNHTSIAQKGSATGYTPILDGITGINYGNDGANASGNTGSGGGGGGAGGTGFEASGSQAYDNHGGIGLATVSISGTNYDLKTHFNITDTNIGEHHTDGKVYFAGGGGGGSWATPTGGTGGLGGGGNGGGQSNNISDTTQQGENGTSHTGGGGGGGGDWQPIGGNGGSGIVIIKKISEVIKPNNAYKSQTNVTKYTVLDADNDYLIAHYKFDDINNVGLDSSSNGNNLTARDGTVEIVSTNSVLGSSSYYTSDSLETNSFTFHNKAFSISVWAYYTGAGNIISQHKNATQNQSLHCQVLTSNSSYIYNLGFFQNDLTSQEYNDSNQWVHLVYQIHLDGTREIWRNGVKIASDTTAFLDLSGSYNVIVGDWLRPSASTRYYNGYLDDLRIYDKALSEREIYYLANKMIIDPNYKYITFKYNEKLLPNLDADITNLIAHYKFDGDYNDSNPSLTKYNLSVSGTPNLSSTIKISGESVYVDASNEFLSTNVNIPMQFDMGFSFWFKRNDNNDHDILMAIGADFFIMAHTNNMFYISNTYGGSEIYSFHQITWNTDWYHFVFNINLDGTWQVYINGTEIPISSSGGTYPLTSSRLPIGKLYIGGKNVGYWASGHDTEGYIDEFRVYNKALTQDEITTLSNNNDNQTQYNINFKDDTNVDLLIVGGGGASGTGGSSNEPGGGGAGGIVYMIDKTFNGNYKVFVGKGGVDSNGYSSKITYANNTIIAYDNINLKGLGGGKGSTNPSNGGDGGSGGGANHLNSPGSSLQGNTFWDGTQYVAGGHSGGGPDPYGGSSNDGGGGGGAGGPADKDNGGIGRQVNITSMNLYYAGGGAASGGNGGGTGGLGGGGDGSQGGYGPGNPGENHTGGGGGAPYASSAHSFRGSQPGGSGIVIIRYKDLDIKQWTYSYSNPNTYYLGNVGIGTYASTENALTIHGDINFTDKIYKNNNEITNIEGWNKNNQNIYRETGKVGIGTSTPQYTVDVNGDVYANEGGFTSDGSTNWTTVSDRNLKENIVKASYKECYENIKNIDLYRFSYKKGFNNTEDKHQLGFIAQEVKEYYPKSVIETNKTIKNIDNILKLDVSQINYSLFGAVKHCMEEVENIEKTLN